MATSFMMKSWQADTYLLGKQKGGCACGYKNEHQQYRSSFTNESVERMRKGKYEYLSFWWRNKSQLLHRQWQGRWNKLPRKQYRKDAQSAGKAVRHALLLWKSGLATLCDWLLRLRDCKSQRCGERSEEGAEGGAHHWKKKSLHPALGARQRRIWKGD